VIDGLYNIKDKIEDYNCNTLAYTLYQICKRGNQKL